MPRRLLPTAAPACLALAAWACPASAQDERPNVLLIYTDDIGYADVSAYAHAAPDTHTPSIDRIAHAGVAFTHAYSTGPICNVGRAGVITGQYPASNGTIWYGGPGLANVPVGTTLPEQLQAAGYRTVSIGKHHYGGIGTPRNTDDELRDARDNPVHHGFDEFFGLMHSEKDYARNTQADLHAFLAHAMGQGVSREEAHRRARHAVVGPMIRAVPATTERGALTFARESHDGYTTDLFTDEAIRQVTRAVDEGSPFYIQVNYNSLHTQLWNAVPQRFLDARGVTDEEQAAYSPGAYDGTIEFYAWNSDHAWFDAGDADDQLGDINDPRDTPANRFRRKLYLAAMDHLDENLGRLLDTLDDRGLSGNTIVVFTTDNGGSHNIGADNAPLTGHKYMLGEGGVRVPFLVAWPGHATPGGTLDDAVTQMDLTPTLLAAAGVTPAAPTDGRDLAPLLAGDASQGYRTQFWIGSSTHAVRHADWKLIVNAQQREFPNFTEPVGTFLYHLATDPGERHNLADEQPEVVAALLTLHEDWGANGYRVGPMYRDDSLITNGSFEHTPGINQLPDEWVSTATTEHTGATVGGTLGADDGVFRAYLSAPDAYLTQTTDYVLQPGDRVTLRFAVDSQGGQDAGVLAELFTVDDAGQETVTPHKLGAAADDDEPGAWQTVEAAFLIDAAHTSHVGQRLGVRFSATGGEGFRAIDDVELHVTPAR